MGHRTQTSAPVGSCVSATDRGVCLAQAFLNITSAKFPPKGSLIAQGNETKKLLRKGGGVHQQRKRKRVSLHLVQEAKVHMPGSFLFMPG